MLKFLKDWTLPLAMGIGALGYPLFMYLSPITPALIFIMLLLTFCKISLKDLKITPLHWWLLSIQIFGALFVYLLLYRFDKIVAEGAMVCVMAPTATAAVVITSKLGGSAASVTTYTLLANTATAIAAPVLFPLIELHPEISFWQSFFTILGRVFPVLIVPILIAWMLEYFFPKVHSKLLSLHELAFYLWAFSLSIVTAQTLNSLLESTANVMTEIMIAAAALVMCGLQFFLGKTIGSVYNDRISGGQALGQKNTILAIWMAYTYLNPLASVGPGSYVLWQNIVNSWQLWKRRNKEKSSV